MSTLWWAGAHSTKIIFYLLQKISEARLNLIGIGNDLLVSTISNLASRADKKV
jgi:hypothetical protein